jgi:hypothetical protein
MKNLKNFKEFLNESMRPELPLSNAMIPELPLSKQEIEIRKLFSMPLGPVIKKLTEWILYRTLYSNKDAEFDLHTVISKSGKELVYYFQWEFDDDLPPDYAPSSKMSVAARPMRPMSNSEIFSKLVPNCKTIELDFDDGMPSSELIGVMMNDGNQSWINKVRKEEDAELYNGTLQKKFSPYDNLDDYVFYIIKELGLDPLDFFGWASSNLSVSAYQNKIRGKIIGRRFNV